MVDFDKANRQYSLKELESFIENGQPIDGLSYQGAARIKIERLVPYIILCQHSGTYIDPFLKSKMAISKEQRRYEEDLHLDELFESHPYHYLCDPLSLPVRH